jgi:glyoxylase-like metal-dependent hydrolase (beta-lactamase superfamily II)
MELPDDVFPVRAPGVSFCVLRDAAGLYLIDGGFIGGRSLLQRALRRHGCEREPIRGIIVTHGHLDHILNVAKGARPGTAGSHSNHCDRANPAEHLRRLRSLV